MNILEELWYGNIAPYEISIVKGSEYDQASNLAIEHDTALTTNCENRLVWLYYISRIRIAKKAINQV